MLIVYWIVSEMIVTTKKNEKGTVKVWFAKNTGSDIEEFDREEMSDGSVCVSTRMKVR